MIKFFFLCVILIFTCLSISSCSFFEEPVGESELVSVYAKDETTTFYLYGTLKITNKSNKNIYSETISVEAKTNKRSYYKTVAMNITIVPGNTVYIPITMDFYQKATESPKEKWDEKSMKIIRENYN